MTRDDILAAMRGNQVQLLLLARRHEAARQLFDAACFAGEGKEAQNQREELHRVLDEILDLIGATMTLSRQLMELRTGP